MLTIFSYWYIQSYRRFIDAYLHVYELFESQFSVGETIKHLGQPLFQDYTWQGRAIGFGLRLVRIFGGSIAHTLLILAFLALYAFWLLFPFLCLVSIVGSVLGYPAYTVPVDPEYGF